MWWRWSSWWWLVADGRLRLIGWLGTIIVALAIGPVLARHWPLFAACVALLAVISLAQGILRAVLLRSGRWAISDFGTEVLEGMAIGGALALVLTFSHLLLGVTPSPVIPALVWPTVSFWPESAGRIQLQRFGQRTLWRGGIGQ